MQIDLASFLLRNLFKNRFAYILCHISCNSLFSSDSVRISSFGIVSSPHHYRTQNHNFLKGCVIQNMMLTIRTESVHKEFEVLRCLQSSLQNFRS